jgi:hypothetical protein
MPLPCPALHSTTQQSPRPRSLLSWGPLPPVASHLIKVLGPYAPSTVLYASRGVPDCNIHHHHEPVFHAQDGAETVEEPAGGGGAGGNAAGGRGKQWVLSGCACQRVCADTLTTVHAHAHTHCSCRSHLSLCHSLSHTVSFVRALTLSHTLAFTRTLTLAFTLV